MIDADKITPRELLADMTPESAKQVMHAAPLAVVWAAQTAVTLSKGFGVDLLDVSIGRDVASFLAACVRVSQPDCAGEALSITLLALSCFDYFDEAAGMAVEELEDGAS